MDKYELDRSEMMFVTGMLTRGSVPVGGDGEGLVDEVASAIRALRRAWQDGWADKYADALSPGGAGMSDDELERLNEAAASGRTKPAPRPAPAGAADMSDFFEWSSERLGFGKKICETYNRPWSEVTYMDMHSIHPGSSKDIGYMKWIAGPKFDAKGERQRKAKARVTAILSDILSAAKEKTPF